VNYLDQLHQQLAAVNRGFLYWNWYSQHGLWCNVMP